MTDCIHQKLSKSPKLTMNLWTDPANGHFVVFTQSWRNRCDYFLLLLCVSASRLFLCLVKQLKSVQDQLSNIIQFTLMIFLIMESLACGAPMHLWMHHSRLTEWILIWIWILIETQRSWEVCLWISKRCWYLLGEWKCSSVCVITCVFRVHTITERPDESGAV